MLGLPDKYENADSGKWAAYYWTVLGLDGSETALYADAVRIEPNGALSFLKNGEPFLAINSGLWTHYYATSTLNGAPMGVDRHFKED